MYPRIPCKLAADALGSVEHYFFVVDGLHMQNFLVRHYYPCLSLPELADSISLFALLSLQFVIKSYAKER